MDKPRIVLGSSAPIPRTCASWTDATIRGAPGLIAERLKHWKSIANS
jgi:hypothetical protein